MQQLLPQKDYEQQQRGAVLQAMATRDSRLNVGEWCDAMKLGSDAIIADGASLIQHSASDVLRGKAAKRPIIVTEQTRSEPG